MPIKRSYHKFYVRVLSIMLKLWSRWISFEYFDGNANASQGLKSILDWLKNMTLVILKIILPKNYSTKARTLPLFIVTDSGKNWKYPGLGCLSVFKNLSAIKLLTGISKFLTNLEFFFDDLKSSFILKSIL